MSSRLSRLYASSRYGPHLTAATIQSRVVMLNSAMFMSTVLGCSLVSHLDANDREKTMKAAQRKDIGVSGVAVPDDTTLSRSTQEKIFLEHLLHGNSGCWDGVHSGVGVGGCRQEHQMNLGRVLQLNTRGQSSYSCRYPSLIEMCNSSTDVTQSSKREPQVLIMASRIGSSLEEGRVDDQSPIINPKIKLPNQLRSLWVAPQVLV